MAASTVRWSNVKKNSAHKALRRADRWHIEEQTAPVVEIPPAPSVPTDGYRLVVTTQVYENYGYRWKAKGGNEYHLGEPVHISQTTDELAQRLVEEYRHRIEHKGSMFEEFIIGVEWYGPHQETPDERMRREMREWGYGDRDTVRRFNRKADEDEAWSIYAEHLSVDAHNSELRERFAA